MNPQKLPIARRKLPQLMACLPKKVVDQQRDKMMFDIKGLTAQELDRHNFPYHECIIKELYDTGYVESSAYIKQVIDDNIEIKKSDEIGIIVDIRQNHDLLDELKAGLSRAEFSRESSLPVEEAICILRLALSFSNKSRGILWLADQLFLAAIGVAENSKIDGGKQHAICQYAYARFLMEKYPHASTDEPYRILQNVRHATLGKPWLLGDEVGEPQQLVFTQTSLLLHQILLEEARACRDSDWNKAERFCKMAERRAKDANRDDKLAEAITETGKCLLASKDLNGCLRTFMKALSINIEQQCLEGTCKGYKNVALALQRLGDIEGAEKNLTTMGKIAMENKLTYYLGLALEALGELYLNDGQPARATPHLQEAFDCFMYGSEGSQKSETESSTSHYRRIVEELLTVSETSSRRRTRPSQMLSEAVSRVLSIQVGDQGRRVSRLPSAVSRASVATRGGSVAAAVPVVVAAPPSPGLFPFETNTSRYSYSVSSGQEKMAAFFKALDKAQTCMLMRDKILDWKCNGTPFWQERESDDMVPCGCAEHGRSYLTVIRKIQAIKELKDLQTIRSQSTVDDEGIEKVSLL